MTVENLDLNVGSEIKHRKKQNVKLQILLFGILAGIFLAGCKEDIKRDHDFDANLRQRISINSDWCFMKYFAAGEADHVIDDKGNEWATDRVINAGKPSKLEADREVIENNGADLSFVTVTILDMDDVLVQDANNLISFEISGPGAIVATDNGDPTSFRPFASHEREAFHGLALLIIRSAKDKPGKN